MDKERDGQFSGRTGGEQMKIDDAGKSRENDYDRMEGAKDVSSISYRRSQQVSTSIKPNHKSMPESETPSILLPNSKWPTIST